MLTLQNVKFKMSEYSNMTLLIAMNAQDNTTSTWQKKKH